MGPTMPEHLRLIFLFALVACEPVNPTTSPDDREPPDLLPEFWSEFVPDMLRVPLGGGRSIVFSWRGQMRTETHELNRLIHGRQTTWMGDKLHAYCDFERGVRHGRCEIPGVSVAYFDRGRPTGTWTFFDSTREYEDGVLVRKDGRPVPQVAEVRLPDGTTLDRADCPPFPFRAGGPDRCFLLFETLQLCELEDPTSRSCRYDAIRHYMSMTRPRP
jgi:hypothetical protein